MTATDHERSAPAGTRPLPYGLMTGSALAALIFVIALVVAATSSTQAPPSEVATEGTSQSDPALVAANITGQPLPDLQLTSFDGDTVALRDDLGSKPLVVNFFASTCPPCVKEMPAFEAVHQQLGNEVTFVGINSGEDPKWGREIAEEAGVTYLLLSDPSNDALSAIGGIGMPTTLLVGADGRVINTYIGGLDATELADLLATEVGVVAAP